MPKRISAALSGKARLSFRGFVKGGVIMLAMLVLGVGVLMIHNAPSRPLKEALANIFGPESTFTIGPPAANLIVASPATNPPSPFQNDLVSFSASIQNVGTMTAPPSQTIFRLDVNNDSVIDITQTAPTGLLASSTSEVESWVNVWTAVPGTHRYQICADNLNQVPLESDENNCLDTVFTVPTTVTLSATITTNPTRGSFSLLDVDVRVSVSGTATGPITYNVDCHGDGIYEISAVNSLNPYDIIAACDYNSPGVYAVGAWVVREGVTALASTLVEVIDLPRVLVVCAPSTVAWNGSTTVSWTVNSTSSFASCQGTPPAPTENEEPGWSGPKGGGINTFTGSEVRGPLFGPIVYTYRLSCTNEAGSRAASCDATVLEPPFPCPPTNPIPPDGSSGSSVFTDLDWADACRATYYNVYFGSPAAVFVGSTTISFWDLAPLAYFRTYFWRVEACNASGCVSGPEWRFETQLPGSPVCTISALPQFLLQNQTTTVSWSCSSPGGVDNVTISGIPPPPLPLTVSCAPPTACSGLVFNQTFAPLTTTNYTVAGDNIGGFGTASVNVGVYVIKIKEVLPKAN